MTQARRSRVVSATPCEYGWQNQAHSAAVQDRDGAGPLLSASLSRWPFVELGYADGGYAGPRVANASPICQIASKHDPHFAPKYCERIHSPIRIQVVRRADCQVGFAVIARSWVVERFFAWINRNRRLAKDFEASVGSADEFFYAASVMVLIRRPGRA